MEQELVIKSLGTIVDLPDYIQGYTVLGDGSFTLVIEPDTLLSGGWQQLANTTSKMEVVEQAVPASMSPNISLPEQKTVIANSQDKVMVIEDSVVQRQSLASVLEKFDYQVIQASNGKEALQHLQTHHDIKVIICDIEMPVMNGFEFLAQKRKNSNLIHIPVVMLTTRSSEKHRHLAYSLGAYRYQTKPYSDTKLIKIVAQLIDYSNSLIITP